MQNFVIALLRMRLRHGLVLAMAFSTVASAGVARASCNIIPDASFTFMNKDQCAMPNPGIAPAKAFRGARGWSSHRFAGPREALEGIAPDIVRLQVGEQCTGENCTGCVAPKLRDVDGRRGVDANDYLVALVFGAAGSDRKSAVLIGSNNSCQVVNEHLDDLHCDTLQVRRCVTSTIYTVTGENIFFAFPQDSDLAIPEGTHRFGGPTALVAIERPMSFDRPLLPCGLEQKRCADILTDASNLGFCIDEIYRDAEEQCSTDAKYVDPLVSHFLTLPMDNEFDRVCTESTDGNLTDCAVEAARASKLEMVLDSDGDVLIPMYWHESLKRKSNSRPTRRRVEGSSGYPAFIEASVKPVQVPGEEFLEAQPRRSDRIPGSKRPIVAVDPAITDELGLWGLADKPDSVLYIARRKPVRQVCKDVGDEHDHRGEACEAAQLKCASDCGADNKSKCACECLEAPAYYACEGGGRAGKPCTRPLHCPEGKCSKEPECSAEECPSLFELRGQEQAGGKIVVAREVAQGDRIRGACEAGVKKGKPCKSRDDCDGVRCARFRGLAGAEVTTTLPITTTTVVADPLLPLLP